MYSMTLSIFDEKNKSGKKERKKGLIQGSLESYFLAETLSAP